MSLRPSGSTRRKHLTILTFRIQTTSSGLPSTQSCPQNTRTIRMVVAFLRRKLAAMCKPDGFFCSATYVLVTISLRQFLGRHRQGLGRRSVTQATMSDQSVLALCAGRPTNACGGAQCNSYCVVSGTYDCARVRCSSFSADSRIDDGVRMHCSHVCADNCTSVRAPLLARTVAPALVVEHSARALVRSLTLAIVAKCVAPALVLLEYTAPAFVCAAAPMHSSSSRWLVVERIASDPVSMVAHRLLSSPLLQLRLGSSAWDSQESDCGGAS